MIDLSTDPNNSIPVNWIVAHITFYADDLHLGCKILDPSNLQLFLNFAGKIIMKLQQLGLEISPAKSPAIMSLKGTRSNKVLK